LGLLVQNIFVQDGIFRGQIDASQCTMTSVTLVNPKIVYTEKGSVQETVPLVAQQYQQHFDQKRTVPIVVQQYEQDFGHKEIIQDNIVQKVGAPQLIECQSLERKPQLPPDAKMLEVQQTATAYTTPSLVRGLICSDPANSKKSPLRPTNALQNKFTCDNGVDECKVEDGQIGFHSPVYRKTASNSVFPTFSQDKQEKRRVIPSGTCNLELTMHCGVDSCEQGYYVTRVQDAPRPGEHMFINTSQCDGASSCDWILAFDNLKVSKSMQMIHRSNSYTNILNQFSTQKYIYLAPEEVAKFVYDGKCWRILTLSAGARVKF